MPMKKIAILGCENSHADAFLSCIRKKEEFADVEVVGVYSNDPAAAERLRVAAEAPKPILMGRHLMAMGFRPSAEFGRWLDACYEAQLDGKFTDLGGAEAYFRKRVLPKG